MVLQHAQSSFRTPWNKLEPSRIVATSGALALNIVILMLLLVPAARLVPQVARTMTVDWSPALPKEKIPDPPPTIVKHVPVVKPQPMTPAPTIKPVAIDPLPTDQLVMPTGELPATIDTSDATVAPTTMATAGPVMGVQLQYLTAPPPKYPREDLIARREGTVMLQVLVGVDGKPLEVSIQKTSGTRSLDEAARRFVLKYWTFRPATQDGHPVQAIGLVPIDFRLG